MPFNRLNHNILGEIRPRFRLQSNLAPEDIITVIKQHLDKDSTVKSRVITKDYMVLTIPVADRHYWSPELQIRVEKDEYDPQGRTLIRCLVGPQQSVWAMFAFAYASISLICFFGGLYGLSRLQQGYASWTVWLLVIGAILVPAVYIIAKTGQKTGRDQMLHLISFLYHSIDSKGNVERVEM